MFDINEKLKETILSKIPKDYTNLEKAVFIYYELCKTLEYSMQYYLDEDNNIEKFRDLNNLKSIDGEINKEVVCFTFNAIFLKLLELAGVCDYIYFQYLGISDGKLSSCHDPVNFVIDGKDYSVDATYGVLDNNDLTLSKYSTHKLKGWDNSPSQDWVGAIEKVQNENKILEHAAMSYIDLKKEDSSYKSLTLESRKKLFLDLALKGPDYSILTFNYLLKLKNLFFEKKELVGSVDLKAELLFVKDIESKSYKAILFYNPEGYTSDQGYENFNSLEIYLINLNEREISKLSLEEIKSKFSSQQFVTRLDKSPYVNMLSEGRLHLTPIYEGGVGKFDKNQKPINLLGYIRTIIKTDEKILYDVNKNPQI